MSSEAETLVNHITPPYAHVEGKGLRAELLKAAYEEASDVSPDRRLHPDEAKRLILASRQARESPIDQSYRMSTLLW